MQWPGLFFVFWGLYMLVTSASSPEGYAKNFRSGIVAAIIGPTGARYFFCLLATVIVVFGVLIFLTIIDSGDDAIKWPKPAKKERQAGSLWRPKIYPAIAVASRDFSSTAPRDQQSLEFLWPPGDVRTRRATTGIYYRISGEGPHTGRPTSQ